MKTLAEFVKELKENGFKVYTSDKKDKYAWIHFVKDDKIGYCQIGYFGHYSFETVHKPCKEAGTGFSVYDETNEPTIQKANECLVIAPGWAINRKKYGANVRDNKIIKYKNWDDYISLPINQILKEKQV